MTLTNETLQWIVDTDREGHGAHTVSAPASAPVPAPAPAPVAVAGPGPLCSGPGEVRRVLSHAPPCLLMSVAWDGVAPREVIHVRECH